MIGGFAPGHRAHFQGRIDEVKLFRRALSAEEVRGRHDAIAAPNTGGKR